VGVIEAPRVKLFYGLCRTKENTNLAADGTQT
jgi:hypothetical protein